MLGPNPLLTAQLAAERHARFAAEASSARWRRLLHQPHPAPPCGHLAAGLPEVVVDLRPVPAVDAEPASRR